MKKITEQELQSKLKTFLESRGYKVSPKQRKLPIPRGGERSCQPDVIAYSKTGHKIIVIECKKGSGYRGIGHAFGQLHVDELIIKRIKKGEWRKFLLKKLKIKKKVIPDIYYKVAFPERVLKDKAAKKIIRSFQNKLGYDVYFVTRRKVIQKKSVV